MPTASYWINHRSDYHVPAMEVTPTILNAPYREQAAVLGVMNNYGSNSVLHVKDIQVNEYIGRTGTAMVNIDLVRISAIVGGEIVLVNKYDSSVASLHANVSIVKNPYSVTTSGSYLRRLRTLGCLAPASLVSTLGARGMGTLGRSGGLNFNHAYSSADANTQVYALREGEGFSIRNNSLAPQAYPLEVTVHFTDGTNTFMVQEVLTMNSGSDLFAVLNGAGSGQILYITRVEIRPIRTTDLFRIYNVETCSFLYGGESIVPIAMDSASDAIPASVLFRTNCLVRQGMSNSADGRNARAGGDIIPIRKSVSPSFGVGVALANSGGLVSPLQDRVFTSAKVDDGEIVLREGQGICVLMADLASGWGNYIVSIQLNIVTTPPPAGGGEASHVF